MHEDFGSALLCAWNSQDYTFGSVEEEIKELCSISVIKIKHRVSNKVQTLMLASFKVEKKRNLIVRDSS